ncbi:MAG: peptidase family C69 [Alphaproteobacteria bacterium]|nr:MAG: peptidase family C69 [Alphaproteobacteria bacterium]
MCDTLTIADPQGGGWWLAKNSDREPDEPQHVEFHPRVSGDHAARLKVTYLEIPQVADRHAVLISRPAWIWGAEMGVNEHGVAIGNEAVFSRRRDRLKPRLLGMDLVRLGLERAASAEAALAVITDLLERFGQGGPAGWRNKRFAYDNSFLIADRRGAIILETAGREWAAKPVERYAAISNDYRLHEDWVRSGGGFTRGDFAKAHTARHVTRIAGGRWRRCVAERLLDEMASGEGPSFAALARVLRHHANGDGFSGGSNRDICMHWGGRLRPWRPSATTASMIVHLPTSGAPQAAFTGTMTPCISFFRPAFFEEEWMARHFPPSLGAAGWRRHAKAAREPAFRAGLRHRIAEHEPAIFAAIACDRRGEAEAALARLKQEFDESSD